MTVHSESIPFPRSDPPETGCRCGASVTRPFIVVPNTPAGGSRSRGKSDIGGAG